MPGGDLVTNRSDEVDSGFSSNLDAIQELFSLKDSNPESLIEEEKTFVLDRNGLLPSKTLQMQGYVDEVSLSQVSAHKQLIEDRPDYAIAVASKSSSSLIDESWTSFALTFLDGVENIDYYIHRPDSESGDWEQLEHGALIELERSEATIQAEQFIDSVFAALDPLIDLDFERRYDYYGSFIDIFPARSSSDWSDNILGSAIAQPGWFDILWRPTTNEYLSDNDKNTIVHEIGHALGLAHPEGDGFHPDWTTDDSVMSYNISIDGWDYEYSSHDIEALQYLWGKERDLPELVGDMASLPQGLEDTSYLIQLSDLLGGYVDPDGDILSVASLTSSVGSVEDNGDESWTLTPPGDFYGVVELDYQVTDGNSGSVNASQAITFDNQNDLPELTDGVAVLVDGMEDVAYTINSTDLLQGYTDVDGDSLSISGLEASTGVLTNNNDGTWTLTAPQDFNGRLDLSYSVSDGSGASTPASVDFSIAPVNDDPVLSGDQMLLADGTEDLAYTINSTDLLQGYTDIDGDPLSISGLQSSIGVLTDNNDGTWTFTAPQDFSGQVDLTYSVSDGNGGSIEGLGSFILKSLNSELQDGSISILPPTFQVMAVTERPNGLALRLSEAPDMDAFNLYDGHNTSLDPADLLFSDAAGDPIALSAHWDNATNELLLLSSDPLVAGDYSFTIDSRSDGLISASSGELLDGNADGTPGDSFSFSYSHTTAEHALVIADTARGAGQQLSLNGRDNFDPTTGDVLEAFEGLPVHLSTVSSLISFTGTVSYDQQLLLDGELIAGSDLPADWNITIDPASPDGELLYAASGSTPISGDDLEILRFQATVSTIAAAPAQGTTGNGLYGSTTLIQSSFSSPQLPADPITGMPLEIDSDPGLVALAYAGDTTGNGTLSSLDAQRIQRVVVDLDSGFEAYNHLHPALIGDTTGNGALSSLDAARIQQQVVGLPVNSFPDVVTL